MWFYLFSIRRVKLWVLIYYLPGIRRKSFLFKFKSFLWYNFCPGIWFDILLFTSQSLCNCFWNLAVNLLGIKEFNLPFGWMDIYINLVMGNINKKTPRGYLPFISLCWYPLKIAEIIPRSWTRRLFTNRKILDGLLLVTRGLEQNPWNFISESWNFKL